MKWSTLAQLVALTAACGRSGSTAPTIPSLTPALSGQVTDKATFAPISGAIAYNTRSEVWRLYRRDSLS